MEEEKDWDPTEVFEEKGLLKQKKTEPKVVPEKPQKPQVKQIPYDAQKQKRRERWKRYSSVFKAPQTGRKGYAPMRRGMERGTRSISRFFIGKRERIQRPPQEGNPFFSNFRDFGAPHPLSFGIRVGAGSENDKKYLYKKSYW